MAYRCARSLDVLLDQINRTWPNRSKVSDGWIGDAAHASRSSDHNPWVRLPGDSRGIVTARDFTHDPNHGFDAHALAERLRQARDPRIKYVISNGRMYSSTVRPWQWRNYTGANPHSKHIHVSVVSDARCDDTRPWSGVTPQAQPQGDDELNDTEHKMLADAHAWSHALYRVFIENRMIAHKDPVGVGHDLATPILSTNGAVHPMYGFMIEALSQLAELTGRPAPDPAALVLAISDSVAVVVREAVPAAVAQLGTSGVDEEAMADAVVREIVDRLTVSQVVPPAV